MGNEKLQNFKVGDIVSTRELAKTQGVYFILSNTKLDDNNTFKGLFLFSNQHHFNNYKLLQTI